VRLASAFAVMCKSILVIVLALLSSAVAGAQPTASRVVLPPPSFQPAVGWWTVSTGSMDMSQGLPEVKAAFDAGLSSPEVFNLFNFFVGLRQLSRTGIVIWASTSGRGGPTPVFTRARWPLHLSTFRVDHAWEGQPAANVEQRLRWTVVDGWHLDVRVYFATQHPSRALIAKAQSELNRLRLPG
jgi:hypothetical protein